MVDTAGWPSRMTMLRVVTALVTWVLLCGSGVSSLTPFCTGGPGTQPNPSDPPLPDMSFQSFQAHVEANFIDKGYTMDAEQYLNFDGNVGLIKMFANGMDSRSIYSYNTGEIFNVDTESNCQVLNLTTSNQMNLFGDDVTDGRSHIPPASQALRFGSQNGPVFKGYGTTRGLPTLHWQSCIYWSQANTNFTLDHYFTASNWSTSSTHVMVPVRIEMFGEQTFTNGTAPRTFHHVYDYFDFRDDTDIGPTDFETPNNVVCPGRINTGTVPQLPSNYYYRQEIIDTVAAAIEQADIWYNSDNKYVRVDRRPDQMSSTILTLNPITEIHDFNYGVRYVRDQVTGNCSILPLVNGSFDDMMNPQASKQNGSFILQMKNPLQFFNLDSNYTYSGQRYARDALCDVYTSVRSDYNVPGFSNVSVTFEYYFLSEGWGDDPNVGNSEYQTSFPFRLEVTALSVGYHVVYNFLDFVGDSPSLSAFDVSDCFPDTGKLGFTVQFQLLGEEPKQFNRDKEDLLILKSHILFMSTMDVNPIRLGRFRIEYDNTNVYVSATLVDRTPPAAQFSYVPKSEIEKSDDVVWTNITDPRACADLCVSSEAIVCRSFDYCPMDGYKCKLSKAHIGDGTAVVKQSVCDHFSRNVNPTTAHEKTISEAYGDLLDQLYQNQVQINIPEDDGSTRSYGAIYSSINFGYTDTKPLPSMPEQFSYRMEIVIPDKKVANTVDVWYDSKYKLARYDYRDIIPSPPYYTPYTMTYIHDFNTGISYDIDKVQGNCTMTPITASSQQPDYEKDKAAFANNGAFVVKMKGPLELFGLDYQYRYAGEKTARGIRCDVFETAVPDFYFPTINKTTRAIFQYYFQSSAWNMVADQSSDVTREQPVMAHVMAPDINMFMVYNFYDFDDEDPGITVFDIKNCFGDDQRHRFMVTFDKPFEPYLDDVQILFEREVLAELSDLTFSSAIRFQEPQVNYNLNNVYMTVTLLGQADYILHFTKLQGPQPAHATSKTITNIKSPDDCAQACIKETQFICNSFDICPSSSICRLSKTHVDDSLQPADIGNDNQICTHYSRTVNGSAQEPDMLHVYDSIKDLVYKQLIQIPISYRNQTIMYTANGIRDDIMMTTPPSVTEGYTDTKPLPSMPQQFSYRMEIVIPDKKVANTVDVWYDTKYKLARYDYRDIIPSPPYYSPYTMSYIHDFNTGISYDIDKVQGNCTVTPITASSQQPDYEKDKAAFANNGAFVVKMKGPLEMFGLDYQYRYTGEKTARGIMCDVFETAVPDFYFPTINKTTRAIFQYYFQSSAWNMVADQSSDVTREQPVMAHVMAPDINMSMVYNFYDFDDEDPGITVFDIKNCFGDDQRHRFMVTFDKPFEPYLDDVQILFEREVLAELSDLTFSSAIRFQEPQVNYNLNNVYMTVTLLGQADYILHFTKLQGPQPAHATSKTITNIKSPDDCAQACIKEIQFICNSFDICPSSSICRLSKTHVDDSLQPADIGNDNQICTHYSRTVIGFAQEPDMLHVYDTIKDLVYKQLIQIPISYRNQTIMYTANGIRDDIMMTTPPSVTEGQYYKRYKVFRTDVAFLHNDFVLHQMAVDDCATACSEDSRFDCESFSYCYTTGDCMLNRLHPDNSQNLLTNQSFCDLYAKSYVYDFNKYPGQVLLTPAHVTLASVSSPDMCARNCSLTTDFDCKSFDYCPNLKSCRLRTQHILEVPDTSVVASPMCDHYSRDYIYDFSKTGNSVISSHDDIVVSGVTRDACAKLCVEQSGFECKSFEFCGNTTDCRLSSAQPRSKPVTVVPDKICDLYARAKAGLAVGMLILGVLLGVTALYLVFRFRGKKLEDMSVYFVNKENE